MYFFHSSIFYKAKIIETLQWLNWNFEQFWMDGHLHYSGRLIHRNGGLEFIMSLALLTTGVGIFKALQFVTLS